MSWEEFEKKDDEFAHLFNDRSWLAMSDAEAKRRRRKMDRLAAEIDRWLYKHSESKKIRNPT